MTKIDLFGKKYDIKDFYCGGDKNRLIPRKAGVMLYVRIHNKCNGNCKFCLNKQNTSDSKIDLKKLKYVVKYLKKKDILSTVTITGGEPFINPNELNSVINAIVEVVPNIKISISTNGINLEQILKFDHLNNIEAIHVSRHFYIDKINDEILGVNSSISSEKIKDIQLKLNNVIINTVASKGYIDSLDKVINMCKYVKSLGIKRMHIVSLIDYNQYCKTNYVNVNTILDEAEEKGILKKIGDKYRKHYCECHYYSYGDKEDDKLIVMTRLTHQNYCNYIEQLVYTNDNKLTTGFDSDEIIY